MWDPAAPKLLGTFPLSIYNLSSAASAASMTADTGPGQVYFLGNQPDTDVTALVLSAFDKTNFTLVGTLPFQLATYPFVSNLVRWGANGFSFIAPGNGSTIRKYTSSPAALRERRIILCPLFLPFRPPRPWPERLRSP